MAGPSKYMHLSVDLAYIEDNGEEQYVDIGSEEDLTYSTSRSSNFRRKL
jgi:hypothetical protein